MIAGKDAVRHGEAKNSWLTGTAAWNFVAVTQWILGIRPEHDGLRVEPVIPAAWDGFQATRRFRGTTYEIEVVREASGSGDPLPSPVALTVDGSPIDGTCVPLAPAGTPRVHVLVRLAATPDLAADGSAILTPPPAPLGAAHGDSTR